MKDYLIVIMKTRISFPCWYVLLWSLSSGLTAILLLVEIL